MPYARYSKPAQDAAGNLLTGIWCEVRREDVVGSPLETLFADRMGDVGLSNPFYTADGVPEFFCAGGAFRVRYYKTGYDHTERYVGVGLAAESDLQGFVPMGAWDNATIYDIGDTVTHPNGGTLYLFASKVSDNLNNAPNAVGPADTAFWVYLGLAVQGPPGPAGVIGNWLGLWVTASAYALNDAVQYAGSSYICVTSHTAGTFATDLSAGKWQLAAARGGGLVVDTRAAMKAIDTTKETVATLVETGREGTFVWKSGNFTSVVAADTAEGVYVKANAVAASSGAWVRANRTDLTSHMFGVAGDAVEVSATVSIASGAAALTAAGATFTALDVGKRLVVPGAGVAGAALATTIASFTDATHVTLAANAATTLVASAKSIIYGTDDYAALQCYANICGYIGVPFRLTDTAESYAISAKIVFKVTRNLDATDTTPASDLHFTDNLPFVIEGLGNAKLVATASMTSMMELIFDTSDSDIGPFYTSVRNIHFDGAGLATSGIKSDYTMHATFDGNRFDRLTRGIEYSGYGVFRARNNVLRCKYGFYLLGGGGDSLIESNDFFSGENTCAGVYLGYYGGNIAVANNVFTNADAFTGAYGVQAVGSTAAAAEEIRHVVISGNEFCGLTSGIKADGKATGTRNVWDWIIQANHTTQFGASNPGTLLQAADCTDFVLSGNQINGLRLADTIGKGIDLTRCERFVVDGNLFGAIGLGAITLVDCIDVLVQGNRFDDVGKTSSTLAAIDISGSASIRNFVSSNQFRQSSGSYAQIGIKEGASVDYTSGPMNFFAGYATPLQLVGANSYGIYPVGTQLVLQGANDTGVNFTEQVFHNSTATAAPNFFLRRGRGSVTSPAAVANGDRLGTILMSGQYDTTVGNFHNTVGLVGLAAENYTSGARGGHLAIETTPIGSSTRRETHRFKSTGALNYTGVTVANLPTGAAGDTMFATNGRKNGEGAAAGTGVLVFHDGTAWRACDTGATVAA